MIVDYILGESKYIDCDVASVNGESFVITDASYMLFDGATVVLSGRCVVDGHKLSALIAPTQRGRYALELSYTIPPETRIARVYLNVT